MTITTIEHRDWTAQIELRGHELAAVLVDLEDVREGLADVVCDAVDDGLPITEATRAAGVSRDTVYRWLRARGLR